MNDISFKDLGLADPILRALNDRKHDTPTPIQAQAIPRLLEDVDLLGIAQTGTGKTGAFALPILHMLSRGHEDGKRRDPRALVLAPTRELAIQIGDEFHAYGKYLHLRHAVIFGGVSQHAQVTKLRRGVDVIVATPGRLLDLMEQGHINLKHVEHLVLDEADRMLDMGFIRDVRKILAKLPEDRQSLLFSATMPAEVQKLSRDMLYEPERIDIAPKTVTLDVIRQSVHFVDAKEKQALLRKLLEDRDMKRVIIFTRTKHRANRVSDNLVKAGIESAAIHGNKSQAARQKALEAFRKGQVRVLVATDIAARGIDVKDITHVINFELPNESESYVHRIGRTARAGAEGVALSFCDGTEYDELKDIEKLIGRTVETASGERPLHATPGAKKARGGRQGSWAGNKGGGQGRSGGQKRRSSGRRPSRRAA
ncbi:MAG: DEAD/DEAH box helicase [Rhodospirillaceae bacterium]|nr:DEAD/DEAH box helicase [Rhodospirillaceae bacterium]MBT5356740.1 DEAD/DEAH box helicase [Rhodospirillaceae bacterium]MBT5770776.1 DEAD/DEAH box helicase [Rhodospirillaceae bacterium]MBT6311222.1 DEAD/DEAH box helicase [Rhodospirillaceae bacterium]MBT7364458.1 DEAD/DEAH box helicase [Rhodospirillaceae bacterium]